MKLVKVSFFIIIKLLFFNNFFMNQEYFFQLWEIYGTKIISAVIMILVLFIITKIISKIFKKLSKKDKNNHVFILLNKVINIFIWIIWWITLLSNLGFDVSALIAWAGIWGLALALASQKTVANIFGAVSIIINRPFKIWDTIAVWSNKWVVKDIGIIYLQIENEEWNIVFIPNETLISASIENKKTAKK